jgi:hypothetical protein
VWGEAEGFGLLDAGTKTAGVLVLIGLEVEAGTEPWGGAVALVESGAAVVVPVAAVAVDVAVVALLADADAVELGTLELWLAGPNMDPASAVVLAISAANINAIR